MRILHVVRQYAPGVGGLENYVAMLARSQRAMGHDARVLTLDRIFDGDGRRLPAHEVIDGVPVERIGWFGSHRYPIAPGVVSRLRDTDLIHAHGVDFLIDAISATRFLHRKPIILSTHGGFFHTGYAARLKRLFFATVTRWSLMGVRAVLASSTQDEELFAKLWPGRTFLVENGVDVDKFAGLARAGGRTMIYFGRIAPNKEVPRLLRWFAALAGAEPGWRLIVAGKPMGVTLDTLAAEAAALGVADAVEFHDTPDDAELRRLIAQSAVYVCASSYEGFGLAAVEAISAGLYPVLSDIPAFRRTVERIGFGTLVDYAAAPDPRAFSAELSRFTAERPSPDAIARLVAPFSWSRVAERIERITRLVLGRDTRRIGPLDIAVSTRDAALRRVLDAVAMGQPLLVAFANAHTVNMARRTPELVEALRDALVLNDGVGLDVASRSLYGHRFPDNLNGTDFTPLLLSTLPRRTRVFIVGAAPGVAEQAGLRLSTDHRHVEVVGCHHGFAPGRDMAALTRRIIDAKAELVLVGMGNPLQELWARDNVRKLGVPILCIGALLDFTAGTAKRAPRWVRRMRMEWAFRLIREPRRLARRYVVGNASFLACIARQGLNGQRGDLREIEPTLYIIRD